MKVYAVTSNRGFIRLFATRERAEEVAKKEQYHANMRGDHESFYVDELEVEEG